MKIYKLLELHKSFMPSQALNDNFGDGFLYTHNQIFKTIRDQALKLGFKYTEENNLHAMVLPFAQLEQIFQNKKIPLMNNVSVFETFENRLLKQIDWTEIELGYKRNYLFHESCHVVARDILYESNCENKILSLLLEESFANACELYAMASADSEAHQIFFSANSYTIAFEDSDRLNQVIKKFGFDKCFQFSLLAYLHSNFLFPTFTDKDFKVLTQFLFKRELTQPEAQQIGFLAEMAFSLDEGFKFATRGLHFKLNNYSESDFNQIKKTYLKTFISAESTANMLDRFIKVFYT